MGNSSLSSSDFAGQPSKDTASAWPQWNGSSVTTVAASGPKVIRQGGVLFHLGVILSLPQRPGEGLAHGQANRIC